MLLNVEYVKTCKGCGGVFKSFTGSAYCGSECFTISNTTTSNKPFPQLEGVGSRIAWGNGRVALMSDRRGVG